jgi:hypothetical protein
MGPAAGPMVYTSVLGHEIWNNAMTFAAVLEGFYSILSTYNQREITECDLQKIVMLLSTFFDGRAAKLPEHLAPITY